MAYSPRLIANAFIRKAAQEQVPLSHMKLQKLVFFAHSWNLALNDKALLSENFEAWPYGPVVPSLYHELKGYGSEPVQNYLTEFDASTQQIRAFVPNDQDTAFWSLFDQVWKLYGNYSAIKLSDMTHTAGSPWEQARKLSHKIITDDSLKSYFKDLVSRYGSNTAVANT
jgi:uncharacterized phage-associated protein